MIHLEHCGVLDAALWVLDAAAQKVYTHKCDAVRDLIPFLQFKKREKRP